jgi:hypothetical protein
MDRRSIATLRAEARLLAVAGAILLAIGLIATLLLVARALAADGAPAALPIWVGGPPLLFGYLACHFATLRMQRACALEGKRKAARRARRRSRVVQVPAIDPSSGES